MTESQILPQPLSLNSMLNTTDWANPPDDLFQKLRPGQVHVWRARIEESSSQASHYRSYLSTDEIQKAERCRIPHPQYQFVVTRGILRRLLGRYLGVPPTQLRFGAQARGKPTLEDPCDTSFQFNVSHARGMALLAFTIEHPLGIDVEWVNQNVHVRDIAARYFSPREVAYLSSLPSERFNQDFFSFWTCKEAYLKMEGRGLSKGLAQCEITLQPDSVGVALSQLDKQDQVKPCSLLRIHASPEHVGAVAVEDPTAEISYWDWIDEDYRSN